MKRVRELIAAAGATVIYLPTYSPELNPIELWWNALKRELRKQSLDIECSVPSKTRQKRAQESGYLSASYGDRDSWW